MNAESEIGNLGRRVGSCSLPRGGRGRDTIQQNGLKGMG